MVDLSVIIVNYNTLEVTEKCLKSIEKYTKDISYEIILFDNASTDGSKDFFSNRRGVKYLWNDKNLGFGKANNLAYTLSCGRYVMFLNSDTLLLNNAFKLLIEIAEKELDPNIGCWGCMLVNQSGCLTHSYASFPTIWNDLYKEAVLLPLCKLGLCGDVLKQGVVKPETPVDYIIGADLLVRRDVIELYGLFNPRFFMYYEDVELQWRYGRNGIKSVIVEGPNIMHLEGGSDKSRKNKTLTGSIMKLKSKMIYFSITTNKFIFFFYKVFLLIIRIPFLLFSSYSMREKRAYLFSIINSY